MLDFSSVLRIKVANAQNILIPTDSIIVLD